jgi:diguanylate cyclase (GGDEF)-like protein/PAS domain S-box-containing protein
MSASGGGPAWSRRTRGAARRRQPPDQSSPGQLVALRGGDITERSFREIAESIPHIVWLAGPDGATRYFNRLGTDYTGLEPDAYYGWGWVSLVHVDDAERARSGWARAVRAQTPYALDYRLRRADGAFRWQTCRALPIRDEIGRVVGWIGTVTDIDDQVCLQEDLLRSERQAAESLTLLETLQATAPVGFGFVDREFRLVRINEKLAATNGTPVPELLGRTVAEAVPTLWPQLEPLYRSVLETGKAVVNQEMTGELPAAPGVIRSWLNSFYPVQIDDELIGIGLVVVDITERKEMKAELRELAERDPLTGLLNRRRLVPELARVLRYAANYGHHGAVLVLDVDQFKVINDTAGHAAGDSVLRSVADVLRGRKRDSDLTARLGGDEFAVVLPETTEAQALKFASDIRSLLCERAIGPPIYVSIGISLFAPDREISADDALVAADVAQYQAKQSGGDQSRLYTGHGSGALSWIEQIRTALAEDRFVLYGQPILDLGTGEVTFHELLIRMLSQAGEIIPPAKFLPTAEQFHLIGDIDRWATEHALRLATDGHSVTVNLSGASIGDPRLLALVRSAIADGLDPANVIFEITETAATANFEAAQLFAGTLEGIGCGLALDDFGTGFGSFTYLKYVNARYLKIDMEFINGIEHDPTDQEIVRSMVGIARSLGKKTIAEGVEHAATLTMLKDYGVDFVQGFYIGRPDRPSPPTAFEQRRTAV